MKVASFTGIPKGNAASLGHNAIKRMSCQITETLSSTQSRLLIGNQSEEEDSVEHDSILADTRNPPSVEDEVVSLLVSAIVGNIIEAWDGEPCMRTVFHPDTLMNQKSASGLNIRSQETEKADSGVSGSATSSPSSKKRLAFTDNISSRDKASLLESANSSKTSANRINSSNIDYPIMEQDELAVEDKISEELQTWRLTELDQLATITFVNGNHYQGRLSRNLMDGEGTFRWHDGSSYTGQFVSGNITGIGLLEWPDFDWYEGDFYCGYRHGYGQMVPASMRGVCYIGDWCLGKKHGNGAIFYQQYKDYYTGQWADGEKHGVGLRVYSSGTHYQGQWKGGVRHGQGTMVWANNDVYSGEWKDGMMDGYGEYTWNTCYNQYFALPSENFYGGEWWRGLKHGNGLLKLASGVEVKGEWFEGMKHGLAYIFTSNGLYTVMFTEDHIDKVLGKRPSEPPRSIRTVTHSRAARLASKTSKASKSSKDLGEHVSRKSGSSHMEARQNSVPVNWPSHRIQLDFYVERLKRHRKQFKRGYCTRKAHFVYPEGVSMAEFEKTWIENVIMRHLVELKTIYNRYAAICEDPNTFHFKPVLIRFLFWQFLRDCNFHKHNLSLGHIDLLMEKSPLIYIKNKYSPFEKIYFWQFLHCLFELSWELYSRRRKGVQTTPGQLASGLEKLIRDDILPNTDNHTGNALFSCKNLLPINAVYRLYSNLSSKPLTVRELLFLVHAVDQDSLKSSEQQQHTPLQGINVIGVGGTFNYIIESSLAQDTVVPTYTLTCLRHKGPRNFLNTVAMVCPLVKQDGVIVDIDYQLTFLEFFEVLLMHAEISYKREVKRKLLEIENRKNAESISAIKLKKQLKNKSSSTTVSNRLKSGEKKSKKSRQSSVK